MTIIDRASAFAKRAHAGQSTLLALVAAIFLAASSTLFYSLINQTSTSQSNISDSEFKAAFDHFQAAFEKGDSAGMQEAIKEQCAAIHYRDGPCRTKAMQ